jgi:quinol monooxygenase YgiN
MRLSLAFADQVHLQLQPIPRRLIMASILIQHKVKDFQEWKKVFDGSAGLRTASGELSYQIFRDVGNPNSLTILNKWNSLENAQKFVHSPELMAAMEKAGVEGPPNVSFLSEA